MDKFGKICCGALLLAVGYIGYREVIQPIYNIANKKPEVAYQQNEQKQGESQKQGQLEAKVSKSGIQQAFDAKSKRQYSDYANVLDEMVSENPEFANKLLRRQVGLMKSEGIEYETKTKVVIFSETRDLIEYHPKSADYLGPKAKSRIKEVLREEEPDYLRKIGEKAKGIFEKSKEKTDDMLSRKKKQAEEDD
jgi:hypothetical protein